MRGLGGDGAELLEEGEVVEFVEGFGDLAVFKAAEDDGGEGDLVAGGGEAEGGGGVGAGEEDACGGEVVFDADVGEGAVGVGEGAAEGVVPAAEGVAADDGVAGEAVVEDVRGHEGVDNGFIALGVGLAEEFAEDGFEFVGGVAEGIVGMRLGGGGSHGGTSGKLWQARAIGCA